MVRHRQPPVAATDPDQRETNQGWARQVEPLQPVGLDQITRIAGVTPIVLGPTHRHVIEHQLHRVALPVGDERGTQVFVAIQQSLCRRSQSGHIDSPGQGEHRL